MTKKESEPAAEALAPVKAALARLVEIASRPRPVTQPSAQKLPTLAERTAEKMRGRVASPVPFKAGGPTLADRRTEEWVAKSGPVVKPSARERFVRREGHFNEPIKETLGKLSPITRAKRKPRPEQEFPLGGLSPAEVAIMLRVKTERPRSGPLTLADRIREEGVAAQLRRRAKTTGGSKPKK